MHRPFLTFIRHHHWLVLVAWPSTSWHGVRNNLVCGHVLTWDWRNAYLTLRLLITDHGFVFRLESWIFHIFRLCHQSFGSHIHCFVLKPASDYRHQLPIILPILLGNRNPCKIVSVLLIVFDLTVYFLQYLIWRTHLLWSSSIGIYLPLMQMVLIDLLRMAVVVILHVRGFIYGILEWVWVAGGYVAESLTITVQQVIHFRLLDLGCLCCVKLSRSHGTTASWS